MNILNKLPNIHDVNRLWELLPHARLVGGCVRDLMINKPISDIDLATPEHPGKVMDILQKAGIHVIPTGLSHGTVMAVINHYHYEITTLRKDISTDGRHAEVVWTTDWHEDANRRDFTINAMFCDKEGIIYDFYDGQQDLLAGKLRFVGNASLRIQEDVLRVLRYFRFHARYGKGLFDHEAIHAIQQTTSLLPTLSSERVWAEMQKIITGPQADYIVQAMDQYGVLSEILPFGYNVIFFQKMVQINSPNEAILRLAGLVTGKSNEVGKKLRLSGKEVKLLSALQCPLDIQIQDSEVKLRQLKAMYDLEILIGQSWIKQTNTYVAKEDLGDAWDGWRVKIRQIDPPIFPVKGRDLPQIGIVHGPQMGEALIIMKKWWLENGCYADQRACLQWFKNNKKKGIV